MTVAHYSGLIVGGEYPSPFPYADVVTTNTKMKKLWRIWAKSLGEKSGDTDCEADRIAFIRTLIVISYIITNCFIIAGVIRHWN